MGIHLTYFSNFLKYIQSLERDKGYRSFAAALRGAGDSEDILRTVRHFVTIEDDWIIYTEERLGHVERAVHAERQFITQNGEIMRIDQVKHVTPASVAHLAKHSNLITHLPDNPGDKPIPDSLFVEEKISDYAVYENRFLYLLLVTLRDFCAERLKKIREASRRTDISLRVKKTFAVVNHRVTYSLKLSDANTNDEDNETDGNTSVLLSRIEDIYGLVNGMLQTPLMQDMSLVPMIQPPIKRTNVLKMNVDFKKALELYEYIMGYKKDGFTITEKETVTSPLSPELLRELTAAIGTETYLSGKYGLHLEDKLAAEYAVAQAKEAEAARAALQARIEELHNHIKDKGGNPDTYIDLLEQEIKLLRGDNRTLTEQNERQALVVETLSQETDKLNAVNEGLRKSVTEKSAEITAMTKLAEETAVLHERQMADVRTQAAAEVAQAHDETNAAHAETVRVQDELVALQQLKTEIDAQLTGLRRLYVKDAPAEDWTARERFRELEAEYKALQKMYKKEWKKAAAVMRRQYIWLTFKQNNKKMGWGSNHR